MPVVNGVVTLLPAPEGYVVDFEHPQRRAVPDVYYIAGFGMFFSVALMGQRLYTKVFLSGGLQLDDVLLLLAWVTSIITIVLCLHMFGTGSGGVHAWEISIEKFHTFMLDVFLAAPIYALCGSFAKISLLVFYFRLSPQRWFKWSIWIVIAVISSYTLGIFFALIFACRPIAMSWDVTVTEGTCINRPALYIGTAVANIVSDIVLFALPIPMVRRLQIPLKQKIGLLVIFGIGSLTVISSIIRVSILPEMLTNLDQTWAISYASLWIIVEANLLIICAALPTLRKFFRHIAPKLIGESTYGKATQQKSHPSKMVSRLTYGTSSGMRRDKNDYAKFGAECSETYIMATIEPGKKSDVKSGHDVDSKSETAWHDNDSEEAIVREGDIVQTRTVTVNYSGVHAK